MSKKSDDLFNKLSEKTQEQFEQHLGGLIPEAKRGAMFIEMECLESFHDHHFTAEEGELIELMDSISKNGQFDPIVVRELAENRYEVLDGHRRVEACKRLGMATIQGIIRDFKNDDEATLYVIENNLFRRSFETLPYTQKAAIIHQWRETLKKLNKTADELEQSESEILKENISINRINRWRYCKIHEMTDEIKKALDEDKISLRSICHLFGLSEEEQKAVAEYTQENKLTESHCKKLKKYHEEGHVLDNAVTIASVLRKKNPKEKPEEKQPWMKSEKIQGVLAKYFSKEDDEEEIADILDELLNKHYA